MQEIPFLMKFKVVKKLDIGLKALKILKENRRNS